MGSVTVAGPRSTVREAGPPPAAPPRSTGPRRRTGGSLFLPPWTRAPGLVWRQPMVVLAVVAAAAILGCAASSAALFLSSAGSASVQRGVAEACPDGSQPEVMIVAAGGSYAQLDQRVTKGVADAGLPAPEHLIIGESPPNFGGFPRSSFGSASTGMRVVYRDGALDQVTPRSPRLAGNGVLITTDAAQTLRAKPGDTIRIGNQPVRVVGTYENLLSEPIRPFWCSTFRLIRPPATADTAPAPLALATDPATADRLLDIGPEPLVQYKWFVPLSRPDITITQANADLATWQRARERIGAGLPESTVMVFGPFRFYTDGIVAERDDNGLQNRLGPITHRATLIRDGLRGPVIPIALGGSLLALLLVGAAGSYWADRRMREVRLLSSRGVGPVGLAGKALLELAVPAVIGTLLGRLLASWLVAWLGPGGALDPYAPRQATLAALAGLLGGLALLAAVAGLRARAAVERPVGARRSPLVLVPWEVALLGLAAWSYQSLRHQQGVVQVEHVAQVKLLLVSFPLLFLVGAALLGVRLIAGVLRPLRRRAARFPAAVYLAVSRITAAPAISMLLLAALSLPAAMVVYATGITSTVEYTVGAKVRLFTGGTVTLLASDPIKPNAKIDEVGTIVRRYADARFAGTSTTLLVVDHDTFARWAFWDRRFAGPSLGEDLDRIAVDPGAGPIPVLAIRGRFQVDVIPDSTTIRAGGTDMEIAVVDRPRNFPGTHDTNAIIVMDSRYFHPAKGYTGSTEIWGADEGALQAAVKDQAVSRAPTPLDSTIAITQANFAGLSFAFGYLGALAALVGLVAVGGLLLYLETRQRSRVAAYAMSRRMGMSAGTHLRSLVVEMGLLAGAAATLGAGLSTVAVLLVYKRLDVNVDWRPAPLLSVPLLTFVAIAAAAAVVAVLAALYAHRAAARTKAAEILRLDA
jgi:putative ABC transport system permease protein